MTDLVEFYKARLDEDERAARSLLRMSGWETVQLAATATAPDGSVRSEVRTIPDPERMLREVEAKRQIVELHGDQHECTDRRAFEYPYVGCETLRLLAAPFSGEPGYKAEEWAV